MQHIKRSNNLQAATFTGQATFTGDGKFWRSYEPFLDENYANVKAVPEQVNRGLFKGYLMPIWNGTSNVHQELVFRLRVPFRWDGITDPYFCAITAISDMEDVDDKYKFQLEWIAADVGAVLPDTTFETTDYEVTIVDGTPWRAEIIIGTMDAAGLVAGQNWQARLRRVECSDPEVEVTNDPVIFHWCTRWLINKLGTESGMGY